MNNAVILRCAQNLSPAIRGFFQTSPGGRLRRMTALLIVLTKLERTLYLLLLVKRIEVATDKTFQVRWNVAIVDSIVGHLHVLRENLGI